MNDKVVGTITELESQDGEKFVAALPPQQVSVDADGNLPPMQGASLAPSPTFVAGPFSYGFVAFAGGVAACSA